MAVGYTFPDKLNSCGRCIKLTCNNTIPLFGQTDYCNMVNGVPASLIVTVDNTCPECDGMTHIDIFTPAFGKVRHD